MRSTAIAISLLFMICFMAGCTAANENALVAPTEDIFAIEVTPTPLPSSPPTPQSTPVTTPESTPEPTQRPEPTATPASTKSPSPTKTAAATPEADNDSAGEGSYSSSVASSVLKLTNKQRSANGLSELEESSTLTKAAKTRARELATLFSHTRPDGSSSLDISSKVYAENIAQGMNVSEAVIMEGWMNSTGHRANILNGDYGTIGVACYSIDGYDYYVQLFGH